MEVEVKQSAPHWFKQAVTTPREDYFIEVEGAKIHYVRWQDPQRDNKPGLLFVHGGGAHTHWWDFVAPFFTKEYSVAAIDISGMGDSEHRPRYNLTTYANEMMAVCNACGFDRPTIAAHSFGGFATLKAAYLYGDQLTGVVIIDTVLSPKHLNAAKDEKDSGFKPKKTYPDLETALTRFKLLPEQPCDNDFIVDYIARHSLMQVDGGWMWKFDHEFGPKTDTSELIDDVPEIRCNRAVIHGENSIFFRPKPKQWMQQLYGEKVPFISVPNAAHHVFLDEPIALADAVKKVMTPWYEPAKRTAC